MYLPSLQPVSHSESYISGDVTIHPSAVLAPGTILQAAPNSRIVIGAGVCLGMGTILNACEGAIEVEAGAVLGAGVLIFGRGKVGSNACVGTATTIFNTSVESMSVVPAGSLLGDRSRQVTPTSEQETAKTTDSVAAQPPTPEELPVPEAVGVTPEPAPDLKESPLEPEVEETEVFPSETASERENSPVIGKVYINQLLLTLFPKGPSLNSQDKEN